MTGTRILKKDGISHLLQDYSNSLEPELVNKNELAKVKRFLRAFNHHEEFYTETDLKLRQISWSYGFEKWLGHPDKELKNAAPDHFAHYVHPFIADWYRYYNKALMVIFSERPPDKLTFLQSRFVMYIPVRHVNGKYLLVKQMTMPFGLNSKGQVVSFINSYTIFDVYQGEPFRPGIFEGNQPMTEEASRLHELICSCINALAFKKKLTPSHFDIIENVHQMREAGEITDIDTLAQRFKGRKKGKALSRESMQKNLNRMLERLQWLLGVDRWEKEETVNGKRRQLPDFRDVFRLIDFVDQSGMVDVIRHHQGIKPGITATA